MSEYYDNYSNAHARANQAVKNGEIQRKDCCELCGVTKKELESRRHPKSSPRPVVVMHHWNGHNNPLDVWHICIRCNGILNGRHSGKVTKAEMKAFIKDYATVTEAAKILGVSREKLYSCVSTQLWSTARKVSDIIPADYDNSRNSWVVPRKSIKRDWEDVLAKLEEKERQRQLKKAKSRVIFLRNKIGKLHLELAEAIKTRDDLISEDK